MVSTFKLSRVVKNNYVNGLDVCDGIVIKECCENSLEQLDFVDMYVEEGMYQHQCNALRKVLGKGKEGVVTIEEKDELAEHGFSQPFIEEISGHDGYRLLNKRIKRIGEQLFPNKNKMDNPKDEELLNEIAEIGPAAATLLPKLEDEIVNVQYWLNYLSKVFPLGIFENTPEAYVLTKRSVDVLKAIGSMGEEAASPSVPFLIAMLDSDSFLRETYIAVADTLGKMGDERAKESLETALSGNFLGFGKRLNSELRLHCAVAYWRIDKKRDTEVTVKILEETLLDREDFTPGPKTAAYLLGEMGTPEAIDSLIKALSLPQKDKSQRHHLKKEVVMALAKYGESAKKAEKKLIYLFQTTRWDWQLCTELAKALGNMRSEKAKDVLIRALRNSSMDLHRAAAEALMKIDPELAVYQLAKLLDYKGEDGISERSLVIGSSDDVVQTKMEALKATQTLLEIGTPEAISAVEKAIKDDTVNGSLRKSISRIYEGYLQKSDDDNLQEPLKLARL